jgi:hypothetical protein
MFALYANHAHLCHQLQSWQEPQEFVFDIAQNACHASSKNEGLSTAFAF